MKFGIIGYGNLGKAVAAALLKSGDVKAQDICVCDNAEAARSSAEKERFRVYATTEINSLISDVDVVCLVVKGYVFEELSKAIDKRALKDKLVISFMAGVSIKKISSLIGEGGGVGGVADGDVDGGAVGEGAGIDSGASIARAMPSLAIAKNEGVIAYTKIPPEVASIFDKFGFAFEVEEEEIERVTAFASCGLGFAAYLVDAFKEAGQAMGFPPDTAALIAALTFKNACDCSDFRDTVKAVATPGGATEQGINHMDACDVHGIVKEAMQKAYKKIRN